MARTLGTGSRLRGVPGSGTRAPSFNPTPPPLAGQSSEGSAFWVQRWRMGKIRQMGRSRGDRAEAAGRRRWRNRRKRGQKKAKKKRGIDRGMTLPSPTHPRLVRNPDHHIVLLSPGRGVEGLGVLTMATATLPPSLLGSTSTLWGRPNLTQAYFVEVSLSHRSGHLQPGVLPHWEVLPFGFSLSRSLGRAEPMSNMHQTGSQNTKRCSTL